MVPETKNGAKGISDFKLFFFKIIKKIPKIDPTKNEKNKAGIIFGQPKKIPIKALNFASPIPIHFSFETKTIDKKNRPKKNEDKILFLISEIENMRLKIRQTKIEK